MQVAPCLISNASPRSVRPTGNTGSRQEMRWSPGPISSRDGAVGHEHAASGWPMVSAWAPTGEHLERQLHDAGVCSSRLSFSNSGSAAAMCTLRPREAGHGDVGVDNGWPVDYRAEATVVIEDLQRMRAARRSREIVIASDGDETETIALRQYVQPGPERRLLCGGWFCVPEGVAGEEHQVDVRLQHGVAGANPGSSEVHEA